MPSPRGSWLWSVRTRLSIRTKLLKPQKFGRDKDRADATAYKADHDQNDGVGLYYVMVNLYRDIAQSHKRTLGAAINAASTKFRSGSPSIPLLDLQSQVQEALSLKVRIKWDQSLTRRNPLFTEVTKKYSENHPPEPEDSAVELDDLCTDVQLMIERLSRDGKTWGATSSAPLGHHLVTMAFRVLGNSSSIELVRAYLVSH